MAKSKEQPTAPEQLTVSTLRAAKSSAHVLSTEVGDHIAYFSGGYGRGGELYSTSDGKKLVRRQCPESGLRGSRIIGDELWLTGQWGTLAVSRDRGASWTTVSVATRECLWDVVRDAKGVTWVHGTKGTLLKSAKPGAPFRAVKHGLRNRDERSNPRIELVPAGVMFVLFNGYWDGAKFVKPAGLTGANTSLAIAPSGTIIVVGDKGAAFRSTDGGVSYTPVSTGIAADLDDVAFVAGGFIAVGDKGTLRRSENDGVTWKPLASGVKQHLWSIGSWGAGAFVGGDHGLILRIDSPGDTYWKGAPDVFAAKPVAVASVSPLQAATAAELDKRFTKLFAEAEAAVKSYAAKLAQPKHKLDDHAKAILANLDDVDEYKVYGDALQAAGDPRGELIALQTAGKAKAKAADKHLAQHRAALLGALAELSPPDVTLAWANGFIAKARIAYDANEDGDDDTEAEVVGWLVSLLDEPSARFLRDLTVGIVQTVDNSYDAVIREIGRRPRPALRSLFLGDFDSEQTEISWSSVGDLTKLCGACDRLERLTLKSGSMNLGKPGQLVFPRLRELTVITGGLSKESLKAIVAAHLPSLETLQLYLGTENYGCNLKRKDVDALLASERLPRLTRLGLVNSELADELCAVLHLSPLVAQVKQLDLSLGTLSDAGVSTLTTYAKGLAHLDKLDLGRSYVSPAVAKQLQKALPNTGVLADYPRGDQFRERYVSISE